MKQLIQTRDSLRNILQLENKEVRPPRMGRVELRRSIQEGAGFPRVSMGMGSRRERVAGLTCPGTWRCLDAGRAWGCLASCWAHCIHVRTRSLGAATASVPLTLLFNCLFSGKLEQEELWQWLQYPPAPRQQAVWD